MKFVLILFGCLLASTPLLIFKFAKVAETADGGWYIMAIWLAVLCVLLGMIIDKFKKET